MELLSIGAVLLAHRRLLALGLLVAVLAGFMAQRRVGEATSSGEAIQRVLVGPPDAPAIKTDSVATQTLIARGQLLADVMTSEPERRALSTRSGVALDRLAVIGPASRPPIVPVPLAVEGTRTGASAPTPYVLRVESADTNPIMTLTAGAPTLADAQRFVDAGTATLTDLVGRSTGDRVALGVEKLGPVTARTVVNRPSKLMIVVAPVMTLILWCAAIVLLSGVRRFRRRENAAPALGC